MGTPKSPTVCNTVPIKRISTLANHSASKQMSKLHRGQGDSLGNRGHSEYPPPRRLSTRRADRGSCKGNTSRPLQGMVAKSTALEGCWGQGKQAAPHAAETHDAWCTGMLGLRRTQRVRQCYSCHHEGHAASAAPQQGRGEWSSGRGDPVVGAGSL